MSGPPVVEIRVAAGPWRAQLPGFDAFIRDSAISAWRAGGGRGAVEISVLLADDETVRALNARHRGRDNATNVLSFPAAVSADAPDPALPGPMLLGDVVLACETVAAEARAQDKAMADHVRHLVVHGVLHLLGYDHEDDAAAEVMERLEAEILKGFGVADPYEPTPPAVAIRETG